MQKLLVLSLATVCILSTAAWAKDSVYSVNIVGFQKQELPTNSQFLLAAPPFKTAETATLLSIFGTNTLRQNNSFGLCDRVVLYDKATQTYQTWAQWTDGNFYRAGNLTEWNAGIQGNPEVEPGTGFWILSAASTQTNVITFVGDVVMDAEIEVPVQAGLQILAYPFSSELELQQMAFFENGATPNNSYGLADQISVYNNGTYQTYAIWTDGQWYRANNLAEWNAGILADDVIQPGQAFFYRARNDLDWAETNRYLTAIGN